MRKLLYQLITRFKRGKGKNISFICIFFANASSKTAIGFFWKRLSWNSFFHKLYFLNKKETGKDL
jgi:hypothetical protein